MEFKKQSLLQKGALSGTLIFLIYATFTIIYSLNHHNPMEIIYMIILEIPLIITPTALGYLLDLIIKKFKISPALKFGLYSLFIPAFLATFVLITFRDETMGYLFLLPISLGTIPLFLLAWGIGAIANKMMS
jgi:hypothetical protein